MGERVFHTLEESELDRQNGKVVSVGDVQTVSVE